MEGFVAVGQFHHPVQNPHGQGSAADRAGQPQPARFQGIEADVAGAVAVGVVLPLLGEELHRGPKGIAPVGAQGLLQGEEIQVRGEEVGLAPEPPRGMAVGVGDQAERSRPEMSGSCPIGGKAGLQGKNVRCEAPETGSIVPEAGFGPNRENQWGPEMGRHQKPSGPVPMIQEIAVPVPGGPAVGLEIAIPTGWCSSARQRRKSARRAGCEPCARWPSRL
jgi:hypothetical protein